MSKELDKVVKLLQQEEYRDEMTTTVLPSIPNVAMDYVTLQFSGWEIQLHPDGKWLVKNHNSK